MLFLVELEKMAEDFIICEIIAKLLPKNIAKIVRIQLDGWYLLFEAICEARPF